MCRHKVEWMSLTRLVFLLVKFELVSLLLESDPSSLGTRQGITWGFSMSIQVKNFLSLSLERRLMGVNWWQDKSLAGLSIWWAEQTAALFTGICTSAVSFGCYPELNIPSKTFSSVITKITKSFIYKDFEITYLNWERFLGEGKLVFLSLCYLQQPL